jgi:uncharacterized protein (TIGR03067 family)
MPTQRAWMGLVLAASLMTGTALRGEDEKLEGDLKLLQGKWTAPAGDGGKVTYTFKGKKLSIEAPSRSYEITITLDEKAKPEKTIDFQIDQAPDDAKGNTSKGIYKFDGKDKFIFCFAPMGDRPTKYEMVGYEQILTELTRVKD